jgi:hypothetical protein
MHLPLRTVLCGTPGLVREAMHDCAEPASEVCSVSGRTLDRHEPRILRYVIRSLGICDQASRECPDEGSLLCEGLWEEGLHDAVQGSHGSAASLRLGNLTIRRGRPLVKTRHAHPSAPGTRTGEVTADTPPAVQIAGKVVMADSSHRPSSSVPCQEVLPC